MKANESNQSNEQLKTMDNWGKAYPFEFNAEKAIELILYIAGHIEEPTSHSILQILYFADKEHLEKYGRFICGDKYAAMKHGPVPSGVYDLLKLVRGDLSPTFKLSPEIVGSVYQSIDIYESVKIKNKREPDLEMFSASDIECLNNSIKKYGSLSFNMLTDLSHDKAWELADENDLMGIDHIIAGFDNSSELYEHLSDPHPEGI